MDALSFGSINPFCLDAERALAGHAIWRAIDGQEPACADVALTLLAEMERAAASDNRSRGRRGVFTMTETQLLASHALRRWALPAPQARRQLDEQMERIRRINLTIPLTFTDPRSGRDRRAGLRMGGVRLFDLVRLECELPPEDLEDTPLDGTSWMIRPGQWSHWGVGPGERRWIAMIAHVLIVLDYRRQADATAFAVAFARLCRRLTGALEIDRRIALTFGELVDLIDAEALDEAGPIRLTPTARQELIDLAGALVEAGFLDAFALDPDEDRPAQLPDLSIATRLSLTLPSFIPARAHA